MTLPIRVPGPAGAALAALALAASVASGCAADGGAGGSDDGGGDLPREVTVRVDRVVDGDTVEVILDGVEEDVRYIGIDTPESVKPGAPVECFGVMAGAFNERLVEGEEVRLVFDRELRDDYGRLLAYVYLDELFVNAELVRRGFATTLTISPNTRFAALFDRLQQRAGNTGRGLWGSCEA